MAIAFLSTLAVQIGSACFNNFRSKKHAQDLARKQQAYEEKVVREGIENARSEFAELCAFQREMEIEMQKDRLNLIRANHENSLIQAAYENSLGSWPLMVPPYVIKNDTILSVNLQPEKAIPLNCILTTSSDNKFNKAVFYKLEEAIACFCSKYWNVSANKSIRFFQESWRDNFKDIGVKHKDLYAHLSDVPTLVISPVIKNGKLIFRFYWWGLSNDPMDAHLNDIANELDPEVNVAVGANHNYTEEEVATILTVCEPRIEAFISFFADMYYWNYYKMFPMLPTLIKKECISLPKYDQIEYRKEYSKQLSSFCSSNECVTLSPHQTSSHITSLAGFLDYSDFCSCIEQFIRTKTSLSKFTYRDLEILNAIKNSDVSTELVKQVSDFIQDIEENEEIGFVPCIGRNELLQSLLNYSHELGADHAHISPINEISSIVEFFDTKDRLVSSIDGFRDYLFIYPKFSISRNCRFSQANCALESIKGDSPIIPKEEVSNDVDTILDAQKNLIENLSNTYMKLHEELWFGNIDLIDLKYDDLKSIFKNLTRSIDDADSGYLIVGYSVESDNYYFSASLMRNNSTMGDSFVCRSNSLDKKIRTKLNYKSVLKFHIK